MAMPVFKEFTEAQIKQFGPIREREVLKTERRVYTTPFMYTNVKVGDFYEIDPGKGIELKADSGFITVTEDKPIVNVTVVGSGCEGRGYNICEWWDEGESIDNLKDQLVKRQRVDHLDGMHPSIYQQLILGTFPGLTYKDVSAGEMKGVVDYLKNRSDGFYGNLPWSFYENTVDFRVGPPYPGSITIRGGCKAPEDVGTSAERNPGDYAFRVIETTVII
jgi:hypothetical protein